MTTWSSGGLSTALSPEGDQAQELVRDVRGQQSRDLGRIVGRIHLHEVAADEVEPGESPDELLRLAAREAPDLRRPRARRERRVDEVDVERDVRPGVPHPP